MKKILLFLCALFLLSNLSGVYATCENDQIDINSASAEDLDKLSGIGPKYAQEIINTRPFNSVADLIDVKGIGPVTLDKIETQGLACVSGEEENSQDTNEEEETNNEEEETSEEEEDIQPEETQNEEEVSVIKKGVTRAEVSINDEEIKEIETAISKNMSITGKEIETIILTPPNPKGIKSESDMEQLNKNKFAIYGLIVFCILLVILFGFKKTKNEKNEFK